MPRSFVVSLALLSALLIALLGTTCGPVGPKDDILSRTQAALRTAGFDWADPSLEGHEITLRGVLPSEGLREKILQLVGEVQGVHSVRDHLIILRAAAPKHSLRASLSEGRLTLTGEVPDESTRTEIVATARTAARGAEVVDELVTSPRENQSGWKTIVLEAISQLKLFDQGSVTVSGNTVSVGGSIAGPESAARLDRVLRAAMPEGYDLRSDLSFAEAVDLDTCQTLLTEILGSGKILFATSSAEIAPESYPMLDRLSATAQRCADARIEISGHTDSRGAAEMNLTLSEARAASVRSYLTDQGVSSERLLARGYGETRPVGDNDSDAGRARNRRIEFQIL